MSVREINLSTIIQMGLLDDKDLLPASKYATGRPVLGFTSKDVSSLRLTCKSISDYLQETSQAKYESFAHKIFHEKTVGPIPEAVLKQAKSHIEHLDKTGLRPFDLFMALKELRPSQFPGTVEGQSISNTESRKEVIKLFMLLTPELPEFAQRESSLKLIARYREALLPMPAGFGNLDRKINYPDRGTSILLTLIFAGLMISPEIRSGAKFFGLFWLVGVAHLTFIDIDNSRQISRLKKEFLLKKYDKDLYADHALFKDLKRGYNSTRYAEEFFLIDNWPLVRQFGYI